MAPISRENVACQELTYLEETWLSEAGHTAGRTPEVSVHRLKAVLAQERKHQIGQSEGGPYPTAQHSVNDAGQVGNHETYAAFERSAINLITA